MQLREALAGQIEPDSPELEDRPETRTVWSAVRMTVVLATVAVMVLTMVPGRQSPEINANVASPQSTPPEAASRSFAETSTPVTRPAASRFRIDDAGRVTEVSGPDPKIVLSELCAHEQFVHDLSPIALAPTVPASAGTRLGLVRDMRDLSGPRCVFIRRDPSTGRWFVGDGFRPIETQAAPDLPPEAVMTPM